MADVVAIDDEPEWLQLYEHALAEQGHSVRAVADGNEALRELAERPPDAVILDIRMAPSGRDIMRRIRRQWPGVPVIVSSAYAGYRNDPDFERADAFLVKSANVGELVEAVAHVLGRRSAAAGGDGNS